MLTFMFKFKRNAKNNLTGMIPTDIGNLINLKNVNLDYNNFTGNICPKATTTNISAFNAIIDF